MARSLDTSGGLFAWQEVAVGAELSGYRVSEVFVDVGDAVQKGQLLAKIDDVLARESLAQAAANVAAARATLQQTKAAAQRAKSLQQSGVLSRQDMEQLDTAAATATAQLAGVESQHQAARQRLEYTSILAPDAGVISTRAVVPGQIANTGTTLFTLIRQGRVEWRAEVPAANLAQVRRGSFATVQRPDGSRATGAVRTVSPGIDANTQRGTAYVDLKLESAIRPGMYVTGAIKLAEAKILTVPLSALSVRDGFSYVFVVNEDKTVQQRRITAGSFIKDRVEIRSGVTPEELIVASGAGFLHDGDTVQVVASNATSAAKAT